jgi:hypothetical protein
LFTIVLDDGGIDAAGATAAAAAGMGDGVQAAAPPEEQQRPTHAATTQIPVTIIATRTSENPSTTAISLLKSLLLFT